MSKRKTPERPLTEQSYLQLEPQPVSNRFPKKISSCISSFIGLVLIGGMAGALLMLGLSVRDLVANGRVEPQINVAQLPTPTLRPTLVPAIPPTIQSTTPPTPQPPTQPANEQVTSESEAVPDSGWSTVQTGLEMRSISVLDSQTNMVREKLMILRLDPTQFRFDVGYSPGNPKTLQTWQQESGAILAINAGYFTADYTATGLTIAQNQSFGSSYGPFAGMVSINGDGPASNLDVRWLRQAPYSPAENLWGAFQSFPILVHSGGTAAFPAESDNGDRSQRTVIGKDGSGRVILIVTTQGWFTLSEISSWLAQSDLALQIAVNLDGGTSTGLILAHPDQKVQVLPFSPLPTVLLIYSQE
ncbi:MAG: hypothetical protein ACI9EW_000478 [Cellvibrionaceae bacterium]|jgi:uncharacterized protein YigE (DUF2233 family)